MNTLQSRQCFLGLLILLGVFGGSTAFQNAQGRSHSLTHATRGPLHQLNAWSLPTPTTDVFGSLTSTWYNEVNPTARRMVYDDSPMEFTFVTLGDDWPTTSDPPAEDSTVGRRRNPFQRAAKWARNVRRRA